MKPFGLLLTGGASSRMGRDKAAIELEGAPLARRTGMLLDAVTELAVEVGSGGSALSGLPAIAEYPPGGGPLAAVAAGWRELVARSGEKRPVLVVACDLPGLTASLLRWLASYPDFSGEGPGSYVSVVPEVRGRPQYLCARWSVPDLERAVTLVEAEVSAAGAAFGPDALFPGESVWSSVCKAEAFDDVDSPSDLAERGIAPPAEGADWVALTSLTLPVEQAAAWVSLPSCGATVVFTGRVRDHAEDRPGVETLAYEAYEEPALERLREVVAETRRRWSVLGRVVAIHRLGTLVVGEDAVVVAVSSPHRDEAFEAARFAIDTLKETVPIWKYEKWVGDEFHEGGEGWGRCAQPIGEARLNQRLRPQP